jgi:hypothetical protein
MCPSQEMLLKALKHSNVVSVQHSRELLGAPAAHSSPLPGFSLQMPQQAVLTVTSSAQHSKAHLDTRPARLRQHPAEQLVQDEVPFCRHIPPQVHGPVRRKVEPYGLGVPRLHASQVRRQTCARAQHSRWSLRCHTEHKLPLCVSPQVHGPVRMH